MDGCGTYLDTMRREAPLVQCITNFVAMNVVANVLLAAGASPAMVHDAEESGEFAAIAQALTINMGTPSPRWVEGMEAAARGAAAAGRPGCSIRWRWAPRPSAAASVPGFWR